MHRVLVCRHIAPYECAADDVCPVPYIVACVRVLGTDGELWRARAVTIRTSWFQDSGGVGVVSHLGPFWPYGTACVNPGGGHEVRTNYGVLLGTRRHYSVQTRGNWEISSSTTAYEFRRRAAGFVGVPREFVV